ncbi:MAG: arsenic transporter [Oscillospiraceae bacterium]|jgi:Na+/H+ antiporter NhaD/arsenite permease-like protein|nr:arsenic transporter [Oscillospiraceae bacterium]
MQFIANALGETGVLWAAVALFALTYVGMLTFGKYRPYIACGSAVLFILLGILPVSGGGGGPTLWTAIDWNVIMVIAGTMGTVIFFIESKMPARMADFLIDKSPNVMWAVILLSVFAGIISAFVDNVATTLMVAPIAVDISKKLNLSPVPMVISIAITSNLEGAATLVGDTTSILLGGAAGMNFNDFFYFKPEGFAHAGLGLFWVNQLALFAATLVLVLVFRKSKQEIHLEEQTKVTDYFPSFLLCATILTLIIVSMLPTEKVFPAIVTEHMNGIICMGYFLIGLVYYFAVKRDKAILKTCHQEMDYFTIFTLIGLFCVVSGLVASGAVELIGGAFAKLGGGNVFVIYTVIVWFSVFISAFVDNIPYVATMLPVVAVISSQLNIAPYVLYFGLLCGATLGGNLTPIGASANVAGLGILRKEGYEVKAGTFMKISVPYTLTAVMVGYVLVWLTWK